jgi:hypothetical protein
MSGRPEGAHDDRYGSIPNEPHDGDAWREFTPWRPGDKTTDRPTAAPANTVREGFKWTEDQPATFDVGDRVENTRAVGGLLGGAVRPGTIGEVTSTRTGLFDDHVTVRFDNGYTEEVSPSDIKYKGWF